MIFDMVLEAGLSAQTIANNMLQYSRQAKPSHRVHESVNDLLNKTLTVLGKHLGVEKVTLEKDLDPDNPHVRVQPAKLQQALVNLIVNAIKYSPENGEVRIETRLLDTDILVEVSDHGPGIRPEDNSQIFALFGQSLRPSTKGTSGLGIGLHLVKRIVELHGGSVGVDSVPNEGSKFWLRIPLEVPSSDAEAA